MGSTVMPSAEVNRFYCLGPISQLNITVNLWWYNKTNNDSGYYLTFLNQGCVETVLSPDLVGQSIFPDSSRPPGNNKSMKQYGKKAKYSL